MNPLQPLADRRKVAPAMNPGCATAYTDIDFDRQGKQVGHFYIPHSPDDDAWGAVRVPLAVLANGEGPTVILEAGNHGDEYEGQLALGELVRNLDVQKISGRLIVIPSINAPAAEGGRRTSPVDGLNLNRAFPGDHAGSLTQQIAAYVNDEILARGDALLSLHAGGSSMSIATCTLVQPSIDDALTQRNIDSCVAFGAPYTVMLNLGDTRQCVAAAVAGGLTAVTAEMAGAGTVNSDALALCREGVINVLSYWGVLKTDRTQVRETCAGTLYRVAGKSAFVLSPEDGVLELCHRRGERVEQGQVAGLVHHVLDPRKQPTPIFYGAGGLLFAHRHPGRVKPGNLCCVVISEHDHLRATRLV